MVLQLVMHTRSTLDMGQAAEWIDEASEDIADAVGSDRAGDGCATAVLAAACAMGVHFTLAALLCAEAAPIARLCLGIFGHFGLSRLKAGQC